ncbi:MAG: MMPL family transporter [Solirubrobacterales bacterium]|nr:MMPL family transporter [Solirubrobacterales bacterium]
MNGRRSIFSFPAGRRAKWVVFAVWVIGIVVATGPLNLPAKFSDAEENESTSFLPGDAESTKALQATEELQGGELASAVIVFRRESGLTAEDRARIQQDVVALTGERFPGVVADGATAASGGQGASGGDAASGDDAAGGATDGGAGSATGAGGGGPPTADLPEGCAGPTTPVPGQPDDYAPFVGPICSEDGKAAIVTAYLKGDGESETILDPIEEWRDQISDPGGGLEVKITGGAGYAADAIKVFETIDGTLVLAAVSLVIFLLIVIYRSPIFFLVPLTAVLFAEALSRSLGYGVSELGVTINGQSSSIMSVLVLGAGTDYALLLVARYREELHRHPDKHVAMATALASSAPAILASAGTVIAALFCLTIAKVNGTAGLGPIGALGVACAALAMLTLLPSLLTIFGRRAFWPFVPHTRETAPTGEGLPAGAVARIADGSRATALGSVILAGLVVLVTLPLVLLNFLVRIVVNPVLSLFTRARFPSLIVGPLDRFAFAPYELRRHRHEHLADETHGFWKRVGDWVARGPSRVMAGSLAVLAVMCLGLLFFSTDLTSNDQYTTTVESVEGQELLAKSFAAGSGAPTDIVVSSDADVGAVARAAEGVDGIESVTGPVAAGDDRVLVQATLGPEPYSTEAYDLIEPLRDAVQGVDPETLVGGPTAVEFDVREAAAWDSMVIPPIVLVVVFLILTLLLRALVAPLVLIGTVILSFAAALGVGFFFFEFVFGFPGADPGIPLFAFVFLVALGVDYNIFLVARAREETLQHGTQQGILRALAVTGGVITSAGIVLAGTFSVLATLPLVFLTEIGFIVAFGVLLDTFLVRSVLVPAIVLKLGDRFWWPSALGRAAPEREPAGTERSA